MNLLKWKLIMDDPRMYLATPATQVIMALREAMMEVKEEGIESRWARHRKLGEMTRDRVVDWGQRFVAKEGHRADTVTSFWVQKENAGEIQGTLEKEHGIMIARGLYEERDKMLRIGHFGILNTETLKTALDALELVMKELGGVAGGVKVTTSDKKA
jgi:aspartate aminotransferase-like enzyme